MLTEEFLTASQWILWLIVIWVLPWKGVALWRAAKNTHRAWFIAMLVLNTLAILPIIYIFFFSKKKKEIVVP